MTVAPVQAKVEERLEQPGARIRIDALVKRYGTLEVFRDISLDVGDARDRRHRRADAVAARRRCCAASTGCIPVDGGEIRLEGERVTEPVAGMAMVFQHFGLFPWKTVYDNVAYGLRMAGVPQRRDRAPRATSSPWSGSPASRRPIRTRCRAACSSAAGSHARSRSSRTCC